jgi:hypothetical protein
VVAGFTPAQALAPRLLVLATATLIATGTSVAVTALSFTPESWPAFIVGNLLVGLTYGTIGALAGGLLGPLAATYTLLLGPMLDLGIAQNPMFGDGTPDGWAQALPGWGAGRVIVDASFSSEFHAWSALAVGAGWSVTATVVLALVLRRSLAIART